MPYSWFPGKRLAPYHIRWEDRSAPMSLLEWLIAEKRRPLRAKPRLVKPRWSIWERRRTWHQHFAGRLGEWPRWRPDSHRPKRPQK
jgi:hypothetical protein